MKPIIGISAALYRSEGEQYSRLNDTYTRSIRDAGAIPVVLPYDTHPDDAAWCLDALDGILFSGGGDLDPRHFGEDPHPALKRISAAYDASELGLFREAARRKMPVFGICRGCQLINVALGGSLIQDIPAQVPGAISHTASGIPMSEPYHLVEILDQDSIMAQCFGTSTVYTNSFHHQAVKELGAGLRICARSRDGIIEAFQGTDPSWFLHAVQFHPEAMSAPELPGSPGFLKLFACFVEAVFANLRADT
jgi:putative glutamine amidotransferase